MTELETIAGALREAAEAGGVPVLATLVSVQGSSFRRPGARLVIKPDGTLVGAISGGCLEKDIAAHAEEVRRTGTVKVVDYDLTSDDDRPWELGMGCAGRLRVVLEPCPDGPPEWLTEAAARLQDGGFDRLGTVVVGPLGTYPADFDDADSGYRDWPVETEGLHLAECLLAPPRIYACGDGPDVDAVARLANTIGWSGHVVRRDERLPSRFASHVAVLLMTHNFQRDLELMRHVFACGGARYLGVLGPAARTARLLAVMAESGLPISDDDRKALHAPVGLDIGAETPQEIALAILAEIRAAFSARPGGSLRERRGPIHVRG